MRADERLPAARRQHIEIAARARDALAGLARTLLKDVAVTCWYDQSDSWTCPRSCRTLAKVDGLSSTESGVRAAGDALTFTVERVKASLEGMDADDVSTQTTALLASTVATQVRAGEATVGVRVRTPDGMRLDTDQVAAVRMRAPDGHLFPLGRVADFPVVPGEPQLTRQDLQRVVAMTGRSSRDLGSTVRDVQKLLEAPGTLPAGIPDALGGQ